MSNEELRYAYHAANAVDAGTTIYGVEHGCRETNPIAGDSPSTGKVVGIALATSAIYELVCSNTEEEHACRLAFLWVKVLADGWNVSQLAKGCN
jgi:hypothetical protein